ncbi:glycosyltransferase family 4 protein [Microbacterium sp. VKM Ac-2870]|uniref:glycosyltransferase family 4 protein n=1 Tax=Microbacterium sp. VKM Ac-2870 TaxID=2783825 RepID=UPI00188D019C|nr:glycosyltransferase family 1 protein [Microbacterium sp. VKM Ac-2870]MBF4561678.1 glycosyltransferase family 4 protein [Microbacterium sp. VKM Ac-2870]
MDQRVAAASAVLLPAVPAMGADSPGLATATLLPRLLEHARDAASQPAMWLILTAVGGRFPTVDMVQRVRRSLQLDPIEEVERIVLTLATETASQSRIDLPMRVVTCPVIDVDTSGRTDYQSGIHRVVRETVSRWAHDHTVELAIWDDRQQVMRSAAPREIGRVTRFGADFIVGVDDAPYEQELIVPWNTVVVLPDVPMGGPAEVLTAIAQCSGNLLTAIGYDLIPITSAETRPLHDSAAAGEWLVPLKSARRVAGISSSATAEFAGFASALAAQGLRGPDVEEISIPAITPPNWFTPAERTGRTRPHIVVSGTREPHKNHDAVLYAAERLWSEGLDFELRFVGGNGWTDRHLHETLARIKERGRPLVDLGRVTEEQLWNELADADAVVFVSLHEGYGLPVVEALAVGTPVLTASYGSQEEIARDGGCLLANPRDEETIVEALRRLVSDDDLRRSLAQEARERPLGSWDQYAAQLWDFLVADVEVSA